MNKVLRLTFVFYLVFLTGCAALAPRDSEYTWVKSQRPELPMQIQVVEQYPEEVHRLCGHGIFLWACAIFYVEDLSASQWKYTSCVVYTIIKDLPQFIVDHERKHCDGWDHVEK
jgi:hypothetical protein